jgi:hypothetical protein
MRCASASSRAPDRPRFHAQRYRTTAVSPIAGGWKGTKRSWGLCPRRPSEPRIVQIPVESEDRLDRPAVIAHRGHLDVGSGETDPLARNERMIRWAE